MPDGQLIEFDHVTKRFGAVVAVSDFSARVNPGVVTGFLGPNGAGKTTTLRMLVGLERATIGTTKIGGKRFSELREPARVIGAMLETPGFRARRTVERHLIAAAKANSIPLSRVGELISFVGLGDDAQTRIAALSLGMRQRLSAATALIGDPGVLVLDEPANGLDPEGIRWMRTLIRGLADEGRTVLVSSHVLSEVEQTADEILVIARGELKFAGTMEDLADPSSGPVVVDAADRPALSHALLDAGLEFEVLRSGLTVRGSDAAKIGAVTAGAGVALSTLQQRGPTLEDVFLDLVNDRYVRAEKPAADDAALFEMPAPDAAPEAAADLTPAEAEAEVDPAIEAEPGAEPALEAEPAAEPVAEAEPEAEPAIEAEPVVDAEPEAEESDKDDRPLPGIAGLAAVASLFNTPSPSSAEDTTPAETDAEAPPSDGGHSDADAADADATRVIEVIPNADTDTEPAESDERPDETDPTDEFFDSLAGDPASEDDDAQEAPRSENGNAEGGDSAHEQR